MPNLPTLIAALTDPNPNTRAQAAEQLAQLGADAQAAAVALVLASGDEAEEVREWATSALEQIGPPSPADVDRLTALVKAESVEVAYWAATLLGRLRAGAGTAVDALAHVVAEHADLSVRQRAVWALGEMGTSATKALPILRKTTADPDPRLAHLAQEAIDHIGGQ